MVSTPASQPSTSAGNKRRAEGDVDEGHSPRVEQGSMGDEAESRGAGPKRKDGPKRASQACLRCRKSKLRCLGGWPCKRCSESDAACDFGTPAVGRAGLGRVDAAVGSEANARLEHLESSVATLLAGLVGGASTTGDPRHRLPGGMHGLDTMPTRQPNLSKGQLVSQDFGTSATSSSTLTQQGHLPSAARMSLHDLSPSQNNSMTHTRFAFPPDQSPDGPSFIGQGPYTASPGSTVTHRQNSLGAYASMDGNEPLSRGQDWHDKSKGKGQKAEERLAVATEGVFEPPFKALVYQPSVWDNREPSRRNTPERTQPPSRDELCYPGIYDMLYGRGKDDPINTGIVDLGIARTLFEFFIDHCHPFFPIVNVSLDDPFNTIRQSPALISAIIAIAARFYNRYVSRARHAPLGPPLESTIPFKLANLAEFHLAHTLLRKQHALSDVQAILLLAAWCLRSSGGGPDAWVVTGHAVRVARRLGVHRVLAQAAESARVARPGTPEWSALEQFMPQWRTWLGWLGFDGLFSLGFGRPQSTHLEAIDESIFLQIRLNQPLPRPGSPRSASLYGDMYLSGQVQLIQIGRDLKAWGELLADPENVFLVDPSKGTKGSDNEMSAIGMFRELNARLDEWSRLWVWSGSPYAIYLGTSAKIARLKSEHMRLCINSYALKFSPEEDEYVASCLKNAFNAAVSTIQTHFESSQGDFALSFATDYLTITVAQAALFLIRITRSSPGIQRVVSLDADVIAHYLKMSVDLLEQGDLSEVNLASFLARTIRDMSRVAGIPNSSGAIPAMGDEAAAGFNGRSTSGMESIASMGPGSRAHDITQACSVTGHGPPHDLEVSGGSSTGGGVIDTGDRSGIDSTDIGYDGAPPLAAGGFDIDNFLQLEAHLDLGYLLALPNDPNVGLGSGHGSVSTSNIQPGIVGFGSQGFAYGADVAPEYAGEFGLGMGGLGNPGLTMFPGDGGLGWTAEGAGDVGE